MRELTRDLPIEPSGPLPMGGGGPDVAGICHDSRRVTAGDLFVAWRGEHADAREYAPQAVERGAVAVLSPAPAPLPISVPCFIAADPRRLLGPLAVRLHNHPDRELTHVGVTGTNGKSTVLALLAAILEADGRPAGCIGTLGYSFGGYSFGGYRFGDSMLPAARTTPEGSDYYRLLRSMRDAGAEAVVSEISSHALEQGRVDGGRFDLAVFTNLTRDHLDYHGDLETYFAAKRMLFDRLAEGGRAAVNADDAYGRRLLDELPRAVGFGLTPAADVRLTESEQGVDGNRGEIETPRGRLVFESPLVGSYNLLNILAAVGGAEAIEIPHASIVRGLASCQPLDGRMEVVSRRGGITCIVDFAHTEAALRAALEAARGLGGGELIAVFGCGGDRDRGKREPMGRAAGELADVAILTSDNPRGEDPAAIVEEVLRGLEAVGDEFSVEIDRAAAIRLAIERATPGSIVMVAGKGHEQTQQIGEREVPFSDREQILAALEERLGPSTTG